MLDTLLPQVLGRRADMERFTGMRTQLLPIGAVAPAAAPRPDVFDRPLPGGSPQGPASDDTSPSDAAPRRAGRLLAEQRVEHRLQLRREPALGSRS